MISLHGVSKRYGATIALQPTDLELRPQSVLALIGPSGCGKSTLLRIMMGLIPPDGGTVMVDGKTLNLQTVRELRRRMGYVIQDGGLFPHLTAGDNVTLMARNLRWERGRIDARLQELADLVRLPRELLDRFPVQLSGGQRQRVGLMRALMLDPEILLMDEPLGALDPLIRAQLQEDLECIFLRLKKTVALVTHDMAEAAYLGNEIALMRDGRILQRCEYQELLSSPANPFVTEFIQAQREPRERLGGSPS